MPWWGWAYNGALVLILLTYAFNPLGLVHGEEDDDADPR